MNKLKKLKISRQNTNILIYHLIYWNKFIEISFFINIIYFFEWILFLILECITYIINLKIQYLKKEYKKYYKYYTQKLQ